MDEKAVDLLVSSLKQAFPNNEAKIYKEYGFDIAKGVRRWIDVVINHPELGWYAIETRGYSINNIQSINENYWKLQHRSTGTYQPLQQGSTLAKGILLANNLRENTQRVNAIHAMVALPLIYREEFLYLPSANKYAIENTLPFIIFREDLHPKRLREILEAVPPINIEETDPRAVKYPNDQEIYQIFISYRREDTKWAAGRLSDRLKKEFGDKAVFFDTIDISGGTKWKPRIEKSLFQSSVLLPVIGSQWVTIADQASGKRRLDDPNDIVRFEIKKGMEKGLEIMPILIDEMKTPDKKHLPVAIQELFSYNANSLRANSFEWDVKKIIADIHALLSVRPLPV